MRTPWKRDLKLLSGHSRLFTVAVRSGGQSVDRIYVRGVLASNIVSKKLLLLVVLRVTT